MLKSLTGALELILLAKTARGSVYADIAPMISSLTQLRKLKLLGYADNVYRCGSEGSGLAAIRWLIER